MIKPNFSQQSITTGKSETYHEHQHDRLIKFMNQDKGERKQDLEKLFGEGKAQVVDDRR